MDESPKEVKKWLEAADKEVKALEEKETWKEVPLSTSMVKVIPGTRVFLRKRAPDGPITKIKARWVLRGDLLDADFETYAPVVAWSSNCVNLPSPVSSPGLDNQGSRLFQRLRPDQARP
jgi:hypothetical protein